MNRNDAIEIARKHASTQNPSYYSGDRDWLPHDWVVDAILEAALRQREFGYNDGYDEGYQDAKADFKED